MGSGADLNCYGIAKHIDTVRYDNQHLRVIYL